MQQANLEMLQRGQAGAHGASAQQQPPQQLQQQQQQLPGTSSPADMFNNLATMYGLPSAQPSAAAGGSNPNPAEAGHAGATITSGGHDMRTCGSVLVSTTCPLALLSGQSVCMVDSMCK